MRDHRNNELHHLLQCACFRASHLIIGICVAMGEDCDDRQVVYEFCHVCLSTGKAFENGHVSSVVLGFATDVDPQIEENVRLACGARLPTC